MAFNTQIFPTTNDVNGGVAGQGNKYTDANTSRAAQNVLKRNTVRYGFNYVSASGLVATFNAIGEAQIRGFDVVGSGTNPTVTLTANTTNYAWLQFTRDGSKNVNGAALVATTSTVPPTYTAGGVLWTDAVLLASLVTNGTTVTSNTDLRYGTAQGSMTIKALGAPPIPTLSTGGTAGATSRTYYIVGIDANGNKGPASAAATLTTGNATLSGTNYDIINLPDMAGYEAYDVLVTNTSTSLVLAVPAGTSVNNTGQATNAYTAPTRDTTGDIVVSGGVIKGIQYFSNAYSPSITGSVSTDLILTGYPITFPELGTGIWDFHLEVNAYTTTASDGLQVGLWNNLDGQNTEYLDINGAHTKGPVVQTPGVNQPVLLSTHVIVSPPSAGTHSGGIYPIIIRNGGSAPNAGVGGNGALTSILRWTARRLN